jgi:hypothetical protein
MAEATDAVDVKARKPHRCWWCDERIEIGTTYKQWTCFGDGNVQRVQVHVECLKAWQSLHPHDAEEMTYGSFSRGCTCEHGRCECKLTGTGA